MRLSQSVAWATLSLAAVSHARGVLRQVESVAQSALAAQGWSVAQSLPSDSEITLEIGLTYQNQDKLIQTLLDRANPKSKNYGQWLKKDAVASLVQPSKESQDAVLRWLASEGITKIATDGTWVTFKTNIETANKVLNADFQQYQREGVMKIRTTAYSLPEDLMKHVDIVHPTTFFGRTEPHNLINHPRQLLRRAEAEAPPPGYVAPTPNPSAASPSPKTVVPTLQVPAKAVPSPPAVLTTFTTTLKPVPSMTSVRTTYTTTLKTVPTLLPPGSPIAVNPPPKQSSPARASPIPKQQQPYFKIDASCNDGIGPDCVKQLYNIGNYTPLATSGSKIAFSSFLNQSAQYADLALYLKAFQLPPQNWTKIFITDRASTADSQKPEDAQGLAGEANLDIQNMMAVARGLPMYEFLTAGKPPFVPDLEMKSEADNTNEPYVPYYQFLLAADDEELPQVISNSYGEPEQTVPRRYAERTCSMIAQLTLRGITIFESSGDTGIGSSCRTNDEKKAPRFIGEFPSTCPWLTSVGGTERVSPEIAWRDSSGGFSDYFQRPDYQTDALETFFDQHYPAELKTAWASLFNPAGRAFPDISAHSLYPEYKIVYGKEMSGGGGTSAASPVWAGIVGLLNDARLRANLPVLGYINPWLYSEGEDFLVDITGGKTKGCNGINGQNGKRVPGGAIIPFAGWNATVGWDPATGLGIPDFQKMLKVVMDEAPEDEEPSPRFPWFPYLWGGRK